MAKVKLQDYVQLEEGMSAFLYGLWEKEVQPIMPALTRAIELHDRDKAIQLLRSIDVQSIAQAAKKGIENGVVTHLTFGAMLAAGSDKIVFKDRPIPNFAGPVFQTYLKALQDIQTRAINGVEAILSGQEEASKADNSHLECEHYHHTPTPLMLLKASVLTPAQKLNAVVMGQARAAIDTTANLTTSRLVNYGFLAQQISDGIDTYQITSVLDGRTCEACRTMHGKTFSTVTAFSQLSNILSTSDPESLKTMAPFLDRSKAAVAELRSMTPDEMMGAGIAIPPYHPSCYVEGTKAYTRRGFVDFRDLDIKSDEFLSMTSDGQLEWVKAVAEVAYSVDKVAVAKSGWRMTEFVVSENHPMFFERRVRGSDNGSRYEQRCGNISEFAASPEHFIVKSSRHIGTEETGFHIAGRVFEAEAFLKFLGYFLSEGHVHPRANCYPVISQEKHFDRMSMDLQKLKRPITAWGGKLVVMDRALGEWCKQFGKAHEKFVPDFVKQLPPSQIKVFLEAYALGDGSARKRGCFGYRGQEVLIYTSSVRMRDDLVELMIRAGYGARYHLAARAGTVQTHRNGDYASNHDCWIVSRLNTKRRRAKITVEDRKTTVYDVELERNHTLLISTDGVIHWGSNCRCLTVKVGSVPPSQILPVGDITDVEIPDVSLPDPSRVAALADTELSPLMQGAKQFYEQRLTDTEVATLDKIFNNELLSDWARTCMGKPLVQKAEADFTFCGAFNPKKMGQLVQQGDKAVKAWELDNDSKLMRYALGDFAEELTAAIKAKTLKGAVIHDKGFVLASEKMLDTPLDNYVEIAIHAPKGTKAVSIGGTYTFPSNTKMQVFKIEQTNDAVFRVHVKVLPDAPSDELMPLTEYAASTAKLPGAALQGSKIVPAGSAERAALKDSLGDDYLDIRDLRGVGRKPGGSVPGSMYADDTGQKWIVKYVANEEVARNEVLAAKLYEALGVEVPDIRLVNGPDGKVWVASKYVNGIVMDTDKLLSGARIPGLYDNFVADAWLSNWDVIGLDFDNIGLVDGRAFRIDVGGALRFRAQGGMKTEAMFGNTVGDIDSLRNPSINPQASRVFDKITDAELRAGAAKVAALSDDTIKELVSKYGPQDLGANVDLEMKLIARRDDIAKRFPQREVVVTTNKVIPPAEINAKGLTTTEEWKQVIDARINGKSIKTDFMDIENQNVLIHVEKRADGTLQTVATFKVRGDAFDRLTEQAKSGELPFKLTDRRWSSKDLNNGWATVKEDPFARTYQAYTAKVGNAEVEFIPSRTNSLGKELQAALKGRVQITIAGDAAANSVTIRDVMTKLGITNHRASLEEQEFLYLTEMAYLKPSAWQKVLDLGVPLPSEGRAFADDVAAHLPHMRKIVKDEFGVDDAAIDRFRYGQAQAFDQGHLVNIRADLQGSQWDEFAASHRLIHDNLSGDLTMPSLVDRILHGGGRMVTTVEKERRGIPPGGISSSSDMRTGGADYFFTRVKKLGTDINDAGRFVFKADPLRRTTSISYDSDLYGQTSTTQFIHENRKVELNDIRKVVARTDNETIIKSGLSLFDDLDVIIVRDEAEKLKILQVFRDHKLAQWPDGRKLEDIVVTRSEGHPLLAAEKAAKDAKIAQLKKDVPVPDWISSALYGKPTLEAKFYGLLAEGKTVDQAYDIFDQEFLIPAEYKAKQQATAAVVPDKAKPIPAAAETTTPPGSPLIDMTEFTAAQKKVVGQVEQAMVASEPDKLLALIGDVKHSYLHSVIPEWKANWGKIVDYAEGEYAKITQPKVYPAWLADKKLAKKFYDKVTGPGDGSPSFGITPHNLTEAEAKKWLEDSFPHLIDKNAADASTNLVGPKKAPPEYGYEKYVAQWQQQGLSPEVIAKKLASYKAEPGYYPSWLPNTPASKVAYKTLKKDGIEDIVVQEMLADQGLAPMPTEYL